MPRLQEQCADFRIAHIFIRQDKRIHIEAHITSRMAGLREGNDAIVEERLVNAGSGFDSRTTDHFSGSCVFHHQEVLAVFDPLLTTMESALRFLETLMENGLIDGKTCKSGT